MPRPGLVLLVLLMVLPGLSSPAASRNTADWPQAPTLRTWDLEPKPVVVAVIDTGVDLMHPALRGRLWSNPGETGIDASGRDKSTNGIDDDANGFVDDLHGWNFQGHDHQVADRQGHGTHIAGLIVSSAGRAPVQLMILKFFDTKASASSTLDAAIKALAYAIDMGAQVINFSAGGRTPSERERQLLALAERRGLIVVAAAGNDSTNSDVEGYYPADYPFENILSVTSVDPTGRLSRFANYGAKTVDFAAVGENVLSLSPGGGYRRMSGSSQATARVAGRAAYWRSVSGLSPSGIRQRLILEGQISANLISKTRHALWIPSRSPAAED